MSKNSFSPAGAFSMGYKGCCLFQRVEKICENHSCGAEGSTEGGGQHGEDVNEWGGGD